MKRSQRPEKQSPNYNQKHATPTPVTFTGMPVTMPESAVTFTRIRTKALIGHILTADEEIRAAGMGDVEFTQMEEETESTAAEVCKAYARGDSSPIDAAREDWLNGLGIDATPALAEFQQLRREFLKAGLKALHGDACAQPWGACRNPTGPICGIANNCGPCTAIGCPKRRPKAG